MGATIQRFNRVSSFPQKVYVDTSYLLYLKSYPSNQSIPIFKSCKTFHDSLLKNRVEMVTSVLAVQEAFYVILYKDGIFLDMKQFKDKNGNPYQKIGAFRRQKPQEFKKSYRKHCPKLFKFVEFLYNLGVKILYPRQYITPGMTDISKRITDYAYGLLNRYELDPMDAFHVAVAKCMGIDYIVSNDSGFKQVDNITLFIYK